MGKVYFLEKMVLTFLLSRLSMDLMIPQSSMARRICLYARRRSTSFQLGCFAASSTTPLHTDVPSPGPTGGGTTSTSCQSTVVSPPCCSSLLFAWLDSTFSTTTPSSTTGTRSTTGKLQPPWIVIHSYWVSIYRCLRNYRILSRFQCYQ